VLKNPLARSELLDRALLRCDGLQQARALSLCPFDPTQQLILGLVRQCLIKGELGELDWTLNIRSSARRCVSSSTQAKDGRVDVAWTSCIRAIHR
jgi:hypothetical protein